MKITPMNNCIFVLPDMTVDKTESGIVLSDYTKKRPTSGTIVTVGPDVKTFKKGDRIIYGQYAGAKEIINIAGKEKELFLMTENDILALIENE